MFEKWLSNNRNNALKNSKSDICHICDDDLNYIDWFEDIIKNEYQKSNYDIITFQALNNKKENHFKIKEKKHNKFSIMKVWSWGITFRRESLYDNNILFDENYWLWTKYPVWEENIFLNDCFINWLKMYHSNKSIVTHPDESSGILYREELIEARIKVFKKLFWLLGWFLWVFYFTILHYKYYKNNFSPVEFFILSFKSLFNE